MGPLPPAAIAAGSFPNPKLCTFHSRRRGTCVRIDDRRRSSVVVGRFRGESKEFLSLRRFKERFLCRPAMHNLLPYSLVTNSKVQLCKEAAETLLTTTVDAGSLLPRLADR